jgi:predicted esterase
VLVTEEQTARPGGRPEPVLAGEGELDHPRAIALVLHGGQAVSIAPVKARQLSVLRMVPIARHLATVGGPAGLAVWRLRFALRGWNKAAATPVADVRWAIDRLRSQHGDVPVVLVGHSMGGRAAIAAADHAGVVAVLGLAPWVVPEDRSDQLAGRRLLVIHGTQDRMTSAKNSKALVDAMRGGPADTEATFVSLRGTGHAMVRRAGLWNQLTTDFVSYAGLDAKPSALLGNAIKAGDVVL